MAAVYRQASEEAKEKLKQWYKQFEKADTTKRKLLDSGKITKEQYIGWRKDEIAKKKHLLGIVNQLTDDLVKSDKIAMGIVADSAPDVFALNANYTAYDIEQKTRAEMPWTMYDKQTVNRLIRENPQLLPSPSVNIPLDTHWNKTHITNAITQGILQGEAIPDIAKRLERVVNMDYNTAVRSARTATTAAECAGRTHVYKKAESMGIELEQEWLATLDGKTRHAHRQLDGQRVPVGQPFQIDGYEIEYPGDPKAPGYLIYNCRCTTVAALNGDTEMGTRSARNPETGEWETVPYMSYQEWEAKKRAENPTAFDLYMKKSENYSTDKKQWNEYRSVLGKEVPNTLDKFQNLKYNDPEKWSYLQGYKRYKSSVPEATASDYSAYKAVKATGVVGSVRVPPEKIDIDFLDFKDDHGTHHGCTLEDAKHYIRNAKCSIKRKIWDGYHTNYYSSDGAAYVQDAIGKINTAFPKEKFDPDTKKMMEVFE